VEVYEEEKLAHDRYAAFADRYDAVVFDHIAASESRHLSAVRLLLQRYGITDPTAGRPAGAFTDSAVRATYDKLAKQGEGSLSAAIAAACRFPVLRPLRRTTAQAHSAADSDSFKIRRR
jgi:hypothetical protein